MKIYSVKINFLLNTLNTCLSFLFPLITFPYVSRVLGASSYGCAEYAIQTVTFFALFASLGVNLYGIRECAKVRDNKHSLSKVSQELTIIISISTIVVLIVYAGSIALIPSFRSQAILFGIAGLSIPCTSLGASWFLTANEQYIFMAVRSIASYLLIVIFMFIFVQSSTDVIAWTAISLGGISLSNIAGFIYMKTHTKFLRICQLELAKHFKPIILFFLTSAATSIYTGLDTVMLGTMTNTEQVGYYAVAVKIKNVLTAIMGALAGVIIPRITYCLSKNDTESIKRLISSTVRLALIYAPFAVACVCIFASTIITLLAGDEYNNSIILLQIMMPAFFCICFSYITSQEFMTPFGFEKQMTISYLCAGAINLLLNLALIPLFGALGAASATTVSEVFVLFYQAIILSRHFNLPEYCQGVTKIIIPVAISIGIVCTISFFLGTSLVSAIIAIATGVFALLLGLLLSGEELVLDFIRSLPFLKK